MAVRYHYLPAESVQSVTCVQQRWRGRALVAESVVECPPGMAAVLAMTEDFLPVRFRFEIRSATLNTRMVWSVYKIEQLGSLPQVYHCGAFDSLRLARAYVRGAANG